jgi:DNA-directed RNA polymerase specialized sigma24 family protein
MDAPLGEEPLEDRIAAELPALRAYLQRLAGKGREVDDLAQEAVLRALRYRTAYQLERPLGAWLRGAALRVFLDARARSG